MTTKINLTKIVKAVALGAAIAVGASYLASCTPKYQKMWVDPVNHGKEADWYKINR
ncbi:MAG: hypothetical protein AABX93_02770 [Nanoarchaeota archaeon]